MSGTLTDSHLTWTLDYFWRGQNGSCIFSGGFFFFSTLSFLELENGLGGTVLSVRWMRRLLLGIAQMEASPISVPCFLPFSFGFRDFIKDPRSRDDGFICTPSIMNKTTDRVRSNVLEKWELSHVWFLSDTIWYKMCHILTITTWGSRKYLCHIVRSYI